MSNPQVEINDNVFPNNVIQALNIVLEDIHPAFEKQVFPRQLRPTDPNYSIGVFPSLWVPQQQSLEMGHNPQWEPTLQTYSIAVQALNMDGDKDTGLARHSTIASMIRRTLYRSEPLRVLLRSLTTDDGIAKESFRKFSIGTQRLLSNDIDGQFVFLSVLDLTIETEIK